MSEKRKRKLLQRKEKTQRHARSLSERCKRALSIAGLFGAYSSLPNFVQEQLKGNILPKPEFLIAPQVAENIFLQSLCTKYSQMVETPVSTENGVCISWADLFGVLYALKETCLQMYEAAQRVRVNTQKNADLLAKVRAIESQLEDFLETYGTIAIGKVLCNLTGELTTNSSLEQGLYWYAFGNRKTPSGKFGFQCVLHLKAPKKMMMRVDGKERPVILCQLPDSPHEPKELVWSTESIGFPGEEKLLPVFIQSHAIEQLSKRIPFSDSEWTFDSLREPHFVNVNDERFLAEYRFCGQRIGYFSCIRIGEAVLIRTFLFLTMHGTPESDLLWRRLKLARRDIEYNDLDNFYTFFGSDIKLDPDLVRIFEECGCGHLIDLRNPELRDQIVKRGVADRLRRFLGKVPKLGI